MPRPKRHRSKVLDQVASVRVKTVHQHLVHLGHARFGFAPAEAEEVAYKAEAFLGHLQPRGENQILYRAQTSHRKGAVPSLEIRLSPFASEDLEVLGEFGLSTAQLGRLARLLDEAEAEGALLTRDDLGLLTGITVRSIGVRLRALGEAGIRLGLAGGARRFRGGLHRHACAIRRVLAGESPEEVRRDFAISPSVWVRIRFEFARVVSLPEGRSLDEAAAGWGIPAGLASDYGEVAAEARGIEALVHLVADFPQVGDVSRWGDPEEDFAEELRSEHDLSPAGARAFLEELRRLGREGARERDAGAVVFYAVAATEPAGRALEACELVPVTLTYLASGDEEAWERYATRALKWTRVLRLTGEAWSQGAYLSQADLAFLLGVHPGVIQRLARTHPEVVLPTRGNMADMGPGLTHAQRIIRLYLEGFTETEIKARTGHTYASIERYLLTFAKVVVLTERGLPPPLIRRAIGCSSRLVAAYLELYHEHDSPDYAWALMAFRRLAEAHPDGGGKKGARKEVSRSR